MSNGVLDTVDIAANVADKTLTTAEKANARIADMLKKGYGNTFRVGLGVQLLRHVATHATRSSRG